MHILILHEKNIYRNSLSPSLSQCTSLRGDDVCDSAAAGPGPDPAIHPNVKTCCGGRGELY